MTKRKKNETASDLACALQYVDYLFPNDEEAMLLTGKDTVEEAAEVLRDSGAGTVAVKCGRRGCYLLEKKEEGNMDPGRKGNRMPGYYWSWRQFCRWISLRVI